MRIRRVGHGDQVASKAIGKGSIPLRAALKEATRKIVDEEVDRKRKDNTRSGCVHGVACRCGITIRN